MKSTVLFPFFFGLCHGYNYGSHSSSSSSLPGPRITSHDQLFRAELGESLVLPCRVANLGEFVLMWKRNSRVLTAGNLVVRKDSRIRIGDDYGLEIADLRADDRGTYTCEVDIMGKPIHISHTVEVLVPPAVVVRDKLVTERKGEDVTLRCAARGNPNPRITWTKKTGLISPGRERQEGLSLELNGVGRHDAGVYVCTATNGVGKPARAEITVQVKYPPEIEIEQNWFRRDGHIEVEIICVVHAEPEAQISWFRRDKKLHETDRQLFHQKGGGRGLTLHIRRLRPSDFGDYSCKAQNGLGEAKAHTALTGTPRPPRFTCDEIAYGGHAYNITWTTDSFEPVTEYKLLYRRSNGLPLARKDLIDEDSGSWENVAIPVDSGKPYRSSSHVYTYSEEAATPAASFSSHAHYVLRNLRAGAVYDVLVKAKNGYGWSDWSVIFNVFKKGVDYSTQQLSALDRERQMSNGGGGDLDYGGVGGIGLGAKSATSSSSSSSSSKQKQSVVSSPSNSDHSSSPALIGGRDFALSTATRKTAFSTSLMALPLTSLTLMMIIGCCWN